MQDILIVLTNLLAVIIVIPFYRVLKGPTVFDRLLGVGAIGTKTLVLICLIGFIYGRIDMFVDIALAYAILNFISVLAIATYFKSQKGEA